MRTNVLVVFLALFSQTVWADGNDTLMLVGKTPVTVSEFEYVYKKNNQYGAADKKTFDEYLALYENFKLKVVEAESLGLDTTENFRRELLGYRNQLKSSYLTDTQKFNEFVEEAYRRSLEDVEVSHILIQLAPNATAKDTLQAYQKALRAKKRLEKEPFDVVARSMSEDASVSRNGGYLGYITSMTTIYPFETAVYNQPIGVVSNPIRSQIGYHIVMVHNRRPAVGEIKVRHILKSVTPRMSESEKARVKQQIDSISDLLQRGADFEELAKSNSDDKQSAVNGGDLPWFGLGRMVPEFEKAAFALQNVGEVSNPVLSPFGWHIIKLEGKRMPEPEAKKKDIAAALYRDIRILEVRNSFVAKLKKDYDFEMNQKAADELKRVFEQNKTNDSICKLRCAALNDVLFSFAGNSVFQKDFAKTLSTKSEVNFENRLQDFVATQLIRYEDTQLERKYPDFGNLMREYHDGILFFELSKQEVWDKASNDTLGLKAYFANNQSKYKYESPRFKGYIVRCKDKKVAKPLQKILAKAHVDSIPSYVAHRINIDEKLVELEKGLWEKGKNAVIDCVAFTKKKYKSDSKAEYPFVFLQGEMLKFPDDYRDVRGRLISDYQDFLDKEWVKRLRAKYPIRLFEDIKKTMQ